MNGLDGSALLGVLADGAWHSGEALARRFGVSRAAVWKRLQQLEALPGVEVERVSGRGYRLREPLELLDERLIREQLHPGVAERLHALELVAQTDSTNSHVRRHLPPSLHAGSAVFAEHQTAGRGRRGRRWVSVFGRNLYLSLAWRFDLPLSALAGLSLVAGVALARVLEQAGLEGHCLKWPNDLLVGGRKLAGILVEASGEAAGPCVAVIGVGVNLHLEEANAGEIDQPWTDLRAHLPDPPGRNRLAGSLLDELARSCVLYQQEGLVPFLDAWRARDGFRGKAVELHTANGRFSGVCHGVDEGGGLLLEQDGELRLFHAGEVSLRGREDG